MGCVGLLCRRSAECYLPDMLFQNGPDMMLGSGEYVAHAKTKGLRHRKLVDKVVARTFCGEKEPLLVVLVSNQYGVPVTKRYVGPRRRSFVLSGGRKPTDEGRKKYRVPRKKTEYFVATKHKSSTSDGGASAFGTGGLSVFPWSA